MSATLILPGGAAQAREWIGKAPRGTVVTFKRPKRTLPQNDRLHAMITKLAARHLYHGQRLDVPDWKLIFMAGLNKELRIVPTLDNRGFVDIGRQTSKLSKEDFTALMDLVEAYAVQNGVDLGDD